MSSTNSRCSDCIHFKTKPHSSKGDLCSKKGVRSTSDAPTACFTPNVTELLNDVEQVVMLAHMLDSFTPQQRRIFMAVVQTPKVRRLPMSKVYFRPFGGDYVSNYVSGYVLGYTSDGYLMLSGNPAQNLKGKPYIAYVTDDDSLLSPAEWSTKYAALIAAGREIDPKNPMKQNAVNLEEPPTIDTVKFKGETRPRKPDAKSDDSVDVSGE